MAYGLLLIMTGKGNVPSKIVLCASAPRAPNLINPRLPRYLRSHSLGVEYLGSSAGGICALKQHPLLLVLLAEGA